MTASTTEPARVEPFLEGGGELGALIRAHDWTATPLGDPSTWPQSLRTTVRLMLNTNHPVLIFWGEDLTILYNDAYRATMGPERHPSSLGARGRLVWDEIWDIIGPEIDQVMRGDGATWNVERLVPVTRHGSREDVYWTYSYSPIDDESAVGGIGGVLVICSDVTEQHRVKETLTSERARLLELFRQAPGFICVLNGPDHVFELVNDSYRRLIGGRDPVGQPVREALPELAGQGFYELLDSVYRTGTPFVGEAVPIMLDLDGTGMVMRYLNFIYQPILDLDGTVTGIVVEGQDVTGTRTAELRLHAVLDTYAAIFDFSRDLICTLDENGVFASVSPRSRELLGYDPEELVGRPSIEFVLPADRRRTRETFAEILQGQPTVSFENRLVRSDGELVPLLWSGVWVAEQSMIVAVARDLSERIRTEELLRQTQRAEALAGLTGSVAHDFNNLLTVIVGNAELLSELLEDDPRTGPMAGMILESAERAADLTQRLLAFSRRQHLEPEPVDLGELIASMEPRVRATLGTHVEVDIRIQTGLWLAMLDVGRMETTLVDLCANARSAMPDGGRLSIEVANFTSDGSDGSVHGHVAPGEYVMVSVSDTGSGIPADELTRVFDPFFTTRAVGEGRGLGLSMAQGFIEQSRGGLTIYSEPGEGTTVRMYLPRSLDSQSARAERAAVVGGDETILLVDDDPLVRRFAAGRLLDLGYTVIEATNGQEALEILVQRDDVDLVFTDVVMPGGMTGAQLVQQASLVRPGIAILYTSGYTRDALDRHGESDAQVHLLGKPYSLEALARHVRIALDGVTEAD